MMIRPLNKLVGIASFLIVALLLLGGVVPATAQPTTNQRLDQIENQIQTMSRYIYRSEDEEGVDADLSSALADDPSGPGLANINVRLDTLEDEIREITGQLDEQNFLLGKLGDQLKTLENGGVKPTPATKSNDEALAPKVEALRSSIKTLEAKNAALSNQISGLVSQIKRLESTRQAAIEAPEQIEKEPEPDMPVAEKKPDMMEPSPENDQSQQPTEEEIIDKKPPLEKSEASDSYDAAFGLIKEGEYEAARTAFQAFIEQYPNSPLYENAYYWLGETYYVLKQYQTSARIFARGYQDNPEGVKAQDNLLKLALSLRALDKRSDACVTLKQLETGFSVLRPAIKQRVEAEQARLKCP